MGWSGSNDGGKASKGFALVVVILILLLASVLVANLVMQVRGELRVAQNVKDRTVGRFLADGGVQLAIFRKQEHVQNSEGTEYERFIEGFPYETSLAGKGRIRYYLVNESGKIDLNTVPRELLEQFLLYKGLDVEDVDIVYDSLLDWRDPDDLHRLNGAEKDYYQSLADPYIPRDGMIQDASEFFLLRGTEKLRGTFNPESVFTVYNSRSRINFNSLTPEMLDFLVEGDQEKIAAYRQRLAEIEASSDLGVQSLTAIDAENIMGSERFVLLQPYLVFSSNNRYYYIEAVGEAGYVPPEERTQTDAEDQEIERHWPGTKIEVLYQWQNSGPRFLVWKERYS